MKMLHLTLKKQWFDAILYGDKREEYREIKPYWIDRLLQGKSPHCDVWDEPGVYDEMLSDMRYPHLRHRNSDELLDYFDVQFKTFDVIRFKNGYAKDAVFFDIQSRGIRIGQGKEEWGAVPGTYYFVLKLEKF